MLAARKTLSWAAVPIVSDRLLLILMRDLCLQRATEGPTWGSRPNSTPVTVTLNQTTIFLQMANSKGNPAASTTVPSLSTTVVSTSPNQPFGVSELCEQYKRWQHWVDQIARRGDWRCDTFSRSRYHSTRMVRTPETFNGCYAAMRCRLADSSPQTCSLSHPDWDIQLVVTKTPGGLAFPGGSGIPRRLWDSPEALGINVAKFVGEGGAKGPELEVVPVLS